ncbi:TonB-dependent receptor [Hymenobacter busanensis]|uniref:TonB-dependent receptor n=1 Tax=Hymenobacter busanensis TaxID=2607656 RepID=A0A7L5A290_9BACT|nr:TonB-dependent receptor [Hymenobacter busanensis]KAA9338158.1 TonB-dependent receptor [Hymenobacter busanensis]QHJ09417.1 TonB-dependent receptor plug domain-containing protein [Hymenobacter busanensis]
MKHFFWLILLLLLVGGPPAAHGQQAAPTVSGTFANASFEAFAQHIESTTPYRFYFDPLAVDSLCINLKVEQQPLAAVLDGLFKNSALHYAIDAQQHVYISGGVRIQPELPRDFFTLPTTANEAPPAELADPFAEQNKAAARRNAAGRVYEIGNARGNLSGKATVAGHLRDAQSGEPVVGATVYVESPAVGTATDAFGYYSLTLPRGRHTVLVRGIGIKNTKRQIVLYDDGKLEIETDEDITPLKEVVIEAEKDKNVAGMQMGLEKLDIRTIRQVPTAFGEADILRVVLTLPGVKSVGEGSTGMNVRGGATDQNLILFNDATVYNPAHLFGFFSAFNPDMLKSVELYKSAVPAKYGGRLSSVLDIVTRDGNKKQFSAVGGIGPLTSRLTLEGPIVKDKASFLVGGRTSYSNWILHLLPTKSFRESSAAFYDLNAHVSVELSAKNALYLTGYVSRDQFKLASDTLYRYLNQNASLKWKHIFNNKLYSVVTTGVSRYDYDITSERNAVSASRLTYGLGQTNGQVDFSYYLSPKHTVEFGASSILYHVSPGSLLPRGRESLVATDVLPREQGLESAAYVSDRIDISPRLAVSVGLRYSLYHALGAGDVRRYTPGLPKTEGNVVDTVQYRAGQVMATYHGPEYRLSMKYALTANSSVKASYNRMRQYIHMLSNTASMSPTDVWKLSDAHIRPQVGDQVALGYYQNFKDNTIETSVETYYKAMHDFVDYKSGATLILNHHLETDVVNAEGQAYGVEVMVKKLTGKINGWVSYTYSRSLVQVNEGTPAERVNGGQFYPSNFDKPHDFTLIGNYRFSRRISASLNMNYSTGRPITLPLAKYQVGNSLRVLYSDRNAYRVPDYYRADFALNIEGNHKVRKLAHSSWTLGVYNLTGRKNPYSIYFKSENGQIKGYKLSIFGRPIPTLTYNFKL